MGNCQCHRLCIPGSNLCVCRRTLGGVSPLPASPAVHVVRGRCVAPVGLLATGSRPLCSRQQARWQHAAKPETDCSADLGGPSGPPTGTIVWRFPALASIVFTTLTLLEQKWGLGMCSGWLHLFCFFCQHLSLSLLLFFIPGNLSHNS